MPQNESDTYFRPDGTPKFVGYARTLPRRPAGIVIMITQDGKKVYQRRFTTHNKDVEETWAKVGSAWIGAVGLSKRSIIGRAAYARFTASLDLFLLRYGIQTRNMLVFLGQPK